MKTKIKNGMIVCGKDSAPLGTVEARVESIGEIDRRVSLTRVALTAGVGLLWKKKVDHRQLFLTIEGPGVAWVDELSVKEQAAARKLAATINAAKAQKDAIDAANKAGQPVVTQVVSQPTAAPAAPSVSATDELLKLVQLRDAGALTEEEFAEQKALVMGARQPAPVELPAAEVDITDTPELAPAPQPVAALAASTQPAGWADDPTGRHQHRYWDGNAWTANVSDNGNVTTDPV